MTTTQSRRKVETMLDEAHWNALDSIAESLDLDTAPLATAVIEGALRLGQVERLAEAALVDKATKRRASPRLPWQPIGDGGLSKASEWVFEGWRLSYHGNPNAGRHRAPGDGWFLTGPGIDVERRMREPKRPHALHEAADFIRQYKREHG